MLQTASHAPHIHPSITTSSSLIPCLLKKHGVIKVSPYTIQFQTSWVESGLCGANLINGILFDSDWFRHWPGT